MLPVTADPFEIARLESERDLYLRLLNLGLQDEPESFLEEALELVTRIVGAHQGYLEIGGRVGSNEAPRWWAANGFPASSSAPRGDGPRGEAVEAAARLTFQEATRRFQARLIRDTLEETGWNILEASRRLEVARSHLYALIRAFGIERGSR